MLADLDERKTNSFLTEKGSSLAERRKIRPPRGLAQYRLDERGEAFEAWNAIEQPPRATRGPKIHKRQFHETYAISYQSFSKAARHNS
jgi:hypothetical protein